MKRRQALFVIPAAVLAIALAGLWIYGRVYSVRADGGNFPEEARAWLSRGRIESTSLQVTPKETLDLDGYRLILAELDDGLEPGPQLGLFHLKRGLGGRYTITRSGYGGGNIWDQAIRDGDRVWYLLGGRNRLYDIREIAFTMEKEDGWEKSYRTSVPEGEYFLTAVEIDSGVENLHCVPGSLRLYDAAGEDVTSQAE